MTHFIFDCDDVLLDWMGGFQAYYERNTATTLDPAGPQEWDIAQWLGCSQRQAVGWVQTFNTSQAFGNLKALPHAREVVWALRDAGHTISVLTACGDGRAVKLARKKNLTDAFRVDASTLSERGQLAVGWCEGIVQPFEQVQFVPLGASKFDHLYSTSRSNADLIFIDDSFRHAQSGVVNGIKTYCLRCSHDRRDEAENPDSGVIWIDDIRGVLECA